MANKPSDKLFELIKSLDAGEKRYFKIDAQRHTIGEKNNYVLLYDAILKQKEPDNDQIKALFKNQAFVKKYSIAKARLYNSILKSLRAYHSNSSQQTVLQTRLHEIEILYRKSLYYQCHKLVIATEKLARKWELSPYLLELSRWEKQLLDSNNQSLPDSPSIASIAKTDKAAATDIADGNELWLIKNELFQTLSKKGKARSLNDLKSLYNITDKAFDKIQYNKLSTRNKFQFNHILAAYNFAIDEIGKCNAILLKNKLLVENNQLLFKDDPKLYISVLGNLVHACTRQRKFKDARNYLAELHRFSDSASSKNDKDLEIKLFTGLTSARISLATAEGDFQKGIKEVLKIQGKLETYGTKLSAPRKAYLYFSIAGLYLGVQNFNLALRWINKLLNDISINKSEDLYCFGQILNVIIHLELGNQSHLPAALRATKRYLQTRERTYRFESIFLSFINQVIKTKEEGEMPELFLHLSEKLSKLYETPYENTVFDYFDFHLWASAKSQGKPFQDLVIAQAKVSQR